MPLETEILIIGGGLAGLTAALHLQKLNFTVTIVEKQTYPHHKVCGEYISNEILPYYHWLGIDLSILNPNHINQLQLTSSKGKSIVTKLPLGGFGLSRYTMDDYLYQMAIKSGIKAVHSSVENVTFTDNKFLVDTSTGGTFKAKYVIAAYGKRSSLDAKFQRKFIRKKSPFLAVKAHYKTDFPTNVVSLNNFDGGYCGVSAVENNTVNICYLADYESFKKHKNIGAFQQNVLYRNKNLERIFSQSEMIFETPLSISQISFEKKEPVLNHVLMIGDTAGLIHPLCGNGMAMAIHSAKILAELLNQHRLDTMADRLELEHQYTLKWKALFGKRLFTGKVLASLISNSYTENIAINVAAKFPSILQKMIKYTHGKPITIPDL